MAGQEVGAALRRALEERGCALGADEARVLATTLIALIADGVLACDEPTAVHGAASPGPAVAPALSAASSVTLRCNWALM